MNQEQVVLDVPDHDKLHSYPLDQMCEIQGSLKKRSDTDYEKFKARVVSNGFKYPFFVWVDNDGTVYVLDGHGRREFLLRMKQEGVIIPDQFPCVTVSAANKKEAGIELLHLNSQYGQMIGEGLQEFLKRYEIEAVEIANVQIEPVKVSLSSVLEHIEEEVEEVTSGDDEVPEDVPAITKPGDVWTLNGHRLMCGDSTIADSVKHLIAGDCVDMVFTDPPYNVDLKHRGKRPDEIQEWKDDLSSGDFQSFLDAICANIDTFLKPGGSFYMCQGWKYIHLNIMAIMKTNKLLYHQMIVWHKLWPVMGRTDYIKDFELILYGWKKGATHIFNPGRSKDGDVWQIKKDNPNTYLHLTQKPVKVPERAIRNSSKRGEVVLDFFGGSGSSLIASEKAGRNCRLMELNPHYCDVIVSRWIRWLLENDRSGFVLQLNGEDFEYQKLV
jgi:DNA modification methylase